MRSGTQIFNSSSQYGRALNEIGDRSDGPSVLAIAAADLPAVSQRGSKREGTWHRHVRGQVACVEEGLVRLRTESATLVASPNRAIWIPPGHWHAATTNAATYSWNLYLSPVASKALPGRPCILGVSRLLDAMVDRAVLWTTGKSLSAVDRRLITVLVDELHQAPRSESPLPMPTDRRLRRIAEALLQDPSSTRTRDEWAAWAGLSARTLIRRFQEEVHMSFAHWRDQAILMAALEHLSQGKSIGEVSDALGYSTPSGFIAFFRRHFGVSPRRYLRTSATQRMEP